MKSEFKKCLNTLTLSVGLFLGASGSIHAESYNLNLRDGDLQAFVGLISTATGKNFVLDKQVRGQKITIITGREIDEDELYETFLSVLQLHGLAAVETGDIIKIIPANKSKYQAVPVIEEPTGIPEIDRKAVVREKDALVTKVIKSEHVPVANMVPILRPMISPTGHLQGYTPSNSIVVTDTIANIDKVTKLVRRMDRPDEDEMEVVTLRFASSSELVKTIQALQGTTQQKGVVTKYKVSADTRTNSLLVSGSKSGRQQVKDIVRRLDRPKVKSNEAEESTQVVYLRYAQAEDLAKVLSTTTANAVSAEATAKGGAGTQKAKVTISADESTNSLIITAEPEVHKNLAEVIKRLDIRRAQVMVEAVIAEVSLGLSHALGVQLGSFDPNGGAPFLSSNLGTDTLTSALSGNFTSVASGLLLGVGGGSAGNAQWGAVLNALHGDVASNILSTPTIVTMDNVEASMVVGQNVPFVTGTTTSSATENPFQTIEREDVGITLKVKPQINAGSSIMMNLEQEVSSVSESTVAADVITNTRSFNTQVLVEDGQMLVIGGLIEDKYDDNVQKVPVLGDLPFIGKAFRSTTRTKVQQNLMVFIHPVILRDVLSADSYTLEKYNKIRGVQRNNNIQGRGKENIRAQQFPDNPNHLLSHGADTQHLQQQFREYADQNQRQANTRTHGYNPNAAPVQRSTRDMTPQQRQQLAKQREIQQRNAVEAKRRRAKQLEQERIAANQRRRQEVLRQDQLRAQQARQRAAQANN